MNALRVKNTKRWREGGVLVGSRPAPTFSFSHVDVIYQSYIGGLAPASALSFSHVDVGDAFQFVDHTALRGDKKLQVGRGLPIYD